MEESNLPELGPKPSGQPLSQFPKEILAPRIGFEPTSYGFGDRCFAVKLPRRYINKYNLLAVHLLQFV